MIEKCSAIFDIIDTQTNKLVTTIKQAIDDKAWDSEHVTGDRLKTILSQYQTDMKGLVDEKLKEATTSLTAVLCNSRNKTDVSFVDNSRAQPSGNSYGNVYIYNGRMYDVPSNFKFPSRPNFEKMF